MSRVGCGTRRLPRLGVAPASQRTLEDAYLGEQIRQIHARSRGTYGAPGVHAELRLGLEVHVSQRVPRLMGDHGLQGVHRRRRHGTTRRDPTATQRRTWSNGTSCRQGRTGCGCRHHPAAHR